MTNTPILTEHGLYDIYALWHVPFWQRPWFYWSAIAVAATGVIIVLLFIYKRFFTKPQKALMPWQKALTQLKQLQQKPIVSQEDGKQFYFALTAILKQYLQERFGYPVVTKTDSEMASYLKDSELEAKYQINDICNGCLFIKYANQQAMAEQIQKHVALAIKLVTETVPTEKK